MIEEKNTKRFEDGLINLASGDPFQITQNSGVGSTFSYTPAVGVYLCITSVGGYQNTLHLVSATSPYVYNWLRLGVDLDNNLAYKKIFGNGIGIFGSSGNILTYGLALSGIEL